jgi:O-antigen/teichoic acid export membrane protein
MTLWERILQGMTAFSLDTIVTIVASVLGARLVFQYLPPAVYGQLALFLSFYATGTIFLSFGLGEVFTAEIARARGAGEHGRAKFLFSRYLALLLTTGTLLLFVFIAMGIWRKELLMWSVMGGYLWLTAPNNAAHTLFHSVTRYRRLAGQSIVRSLSRLVLLATLPWWWPGELLAGVALTYPLTELAVLLISLYLARRAWRDIKGASTSAYDYDEDLLSLFTQKGVYVTLSIPVKKVAGQLPIWFLKAMVGDVGVGAYAAANKAYQLVFGFFRSLETTLFPLASEQAEKDPERLRVALRQAQKYSFWLGVLVAVIGDITAAWIVLLIAGEQYVAAIPLFSLFLWRLLIYAFSQSQRPIFYAIGEQRWLFFTYLLATILEAVFLLMGIHLLGPIGAVWAVHLARVIAVTMKLILTLRLASHLWVDPRGVFRIEGFDRRLWRDSKKMLQGVLKRVRGAQSGE